MGERERYLGFPASFENLLRLILGEVRRSLVDVYTHVPEGCPFRALLRGQHDERDEEASEERGPRTAEVPDRRVDEEDLARLHHVRDIDLRVRLRKDVRNDRALKECIETP